MIAFPCPTYTDPFCFVKLALLNLPINLFDDYTN